MIVLLTIFAVVPWALLAGIVAVRFAARRLRSPTERQVECSCGALVRISKAHLVAATFAGEEEKAMGGGTAVVAEFCGAHCPGGCSRPKEHR